MTHPDSPYASVEEAIAEIRELLSWPSHRRGPCDIDDAVQVVLDALDDDSLAGR